MNLPVLHDVVCSECEAARRSVFSVLTNSDAQHMKTAKYCALHKRGDVILHEGKYPDGLFCIHKGKVKVFREGEDGKEQIVRFATDGDMLGYKALITNKPYVNSVVALDDSHICFIPRSMFFEMLHRNPELTTKLMEHLSNELRFTEERLVHLAQKPLRSRLAETLLVLHDTFGFEADGKTINVVLSREDIANIVGTATESVIRLLAELQKEGIIELHGKHIAIIHTAKLHHIAHIAR